MTPYILSVIAGIIAGTIDWFGNEVQPPLLVLVILLGAVCWVYPQKVWRWVLIGCFMIPLVHLVLRAMGQIEAHPPEPNVFATLISIVPAMTVAMIVVLLKKAVAETNQGKKPSAE